MKLPLAAAALWVSLLASPFACALGLGQPAVHSYLNSPLNVSIPLVDTGRYAPDQLAVRVADRSAFGDAGLEWQELASSVKAEIHAGSGAPEIRLTSGEPANTPWLDLLLKVSTPDGSVHQDVTLLFDPPDYSSSDPASSINSATVGGSASAESEAAINRAGSADAGGANAGQRNAETQAAGATPDTATPASTYVGNGDTLWSVAERIKPDSVSVEQLMLALVEANPRAFPDGNINGMNAGFNLNVPPSAQMRERSPDEAEKIIDYMNTAWRIRGPGGPVQVPLDLSGEALDGLFDDNDAMSAQDAQDDEKPDSPALKDAALGVAKRLGQSPQASEADQGSDSAREDQQQARLERVTRQRDRLRDEVSQLKARVAQLTDELALQEVELARQEMQGVNVPVDSSEDDTTQTPDTSTQNSDVAPPVSKLDIARRGMLAIASEYRWPLVGLMLLLLLVLIWLMSRRRQHESGDMAHDIPRVVGATSYAGEDAGTVAASGASATEPDDDTAFSVDAEGIASVDRAAPEDRVASENEAPTADETPVADGPSSADSASYDQDRSDQVADASRDTDTAAPGSEPPQGDDMAWHLEEPLEEPLKETLEEPLEKPQGEAMPPNAEAPEAPLMADDSPDEEQDSSRLERSQAAGLAEQDKQRRLDEAEAAALAIDDEYGDRVIDYRPPTLTDAPAEREETPMQPTVEFSEAGPAVPPRKTPAGSEADTEWDIEEVAFKPSSQDNNRSST